MKIKIDGKDETKNIGGASWTTCDDTNGEEMEFSSLCLYEPGAHIKVSDDGKLRFFGVIVEMEENPDPPHNYKAMDFSYNLKGDEIIQFKKISADKAIGQLLKRAGIKSTVCSIPTKINKIYKGTIVEIMTDILKVAKRDQGKSYYFEVIGDKVVVSEKKKQKVNAVFTVSDESSITRSIEDLKNEIKIVKGNKVLATAQDAASIKKVGTVRQIEEDDKITKAKAGGEAKTMLSKLNRSTNTKQITMIVSNGYWDIRKNRLIKLEGGGLKGWYNVHSATHSFDGIVHKVETEVSWSAKF